jgi:hypothetical protein
VFHIEKISLGSSENPFHFETVHQECGVKTLRTVISHVRDRVFSITHCGRIVMKKFTLNPSHGEGLYE